MRITSKGQVTIPKAIRDQAGLEPGTEVEFVVEGNRILVKRREACSASSRIEKFRAHLERYRGTGVSGMTTDEIMEMTRGPFDDVDPR